MKEGKAILDVKTEKIVSKKMDVFYNPVMKFNRDVSVLLLSCFGKMQVGLPLAGSGVRGVRFLLELKNVSVSFNDYDKKAVNCIKKNLKLNNVKGDVYNKDANLFLIESHGFDYIDIDPFGSPNPYLDSSVRRISREGVLAVTATDTAALTGTYAKTCLRKYWALPLKTEIMHEVGLRILIRKVQIIGGQYDKVLTPIFSYFKDHYFRVFFRCEKSKKKVDKIVEQHGMFEEAGPMWLGRLWDRKVAGYLAKNSDEKILQIINKESKINTIGFYDITKLAKKYKIKVLPKQEELIKKIKKEGFKAAPTHFRDNSVRSDISEKELLKIMR